MENYGEMRSIAAHTLNFSIDVKRCGIFCIFPHYVRFIALHLLNWVLLSHRLVLHCFLNAISSILFRSADVCVCAFFLISFIEAKSVFFPMTTTLRFSTTVSKYHGSIFIFQSLRSHFCSYQNVT